MAKKKDGKGKESGSGRPDSKPPKSTSLGIREALKQLSSQARKPRRRVIYIPGEDGSEPIQIALYLAPLTFNDVYAFQSDDEGDEEITPSQRFLAMFPSVRKYLVLAAHSDEACLDPIFKSAEDVANLIPNEILHQFGAELTREFEEFGRFKVLDHEEQETLKGK